MSGKKIGYIRLCSFEQNPERQLDRIEFHTKFIDKASAKNIYRPQLEALIDCGRDSDAIIVHSMDCLTRNLHDLHCLVTQLTKKEIKIEFVKEELTFTGEDSHLSKFWLSVMGAFAEFKRALIKERQREGIVLAKKPGAYEGRKSVLSQRQINELRTHIIQGHKKTTLPVILTLAEKHFIST